MVCSLKMLLLLCSLMCLSTNVFSAIEAHEFTNEVDRQRYQRFIEEMRCPKCQNQNLAGSDSPISADLRREIYDMIKLGKSDKEIVDFMVERYGDFILYRPRIAPITYALWGAPVALLVIGATVLIVILHRRRRVELTQLNEALSPIERSRLTELLGADYVGANYAENSVLTVRKKTSQQSATTQSPGEGSSS